MTTHTGLPPSLSATLPNPTFLELRQLRRQIQHRQEITSLEQVAREVGSTVYAEFLPQLWESTTWMRRGRVVGLPPGTYLMLLNDSIRRRRAERRMAAAN